MPLDEKDKSETKALLLRSVSLPTSGGVGPLWERRSLYRVVEDTEETTSELTVNYHIVQANGTVTEKCTTLDFAMGRAKKLSKDGLQLSIIDFSDKAKVIRAIAKSGTVTWYKQCKECAGKPGTWCGPCSGSGAVATTDVWTG